MLYNFDLIMFFFLPFLQLWYYPDNSCWHETAPLLIL